MADYWKSQPKKFCQYCKCWIADNKPSVEFHERGKNHKENVAAKISEIKKKSMDKAKQDEKNSKEFAAMEEAAMKAYEEDLKRMQMESGTEVPTTTPLPSEPKSQPRSQPQSKHQSQPQSEPHRREKKGKRAEQSRSEESRTSPVWVEGKSDDGHTYYYNTLTGESQWEKPEGFQGESSDSTQSRQSENSSGGCWKETVSPEGHTYYYNTATGESSWERPADLSSVDTSGRGPEDGSHSQPEPPGTSSSAPAPEESEGNGQDNQQPKVPKISFRKRKAESAEKEEDKSGSENEKEDDVVENEPGEAPNAAPLPEEEEERKAKEEEERKAKEEEARAKKEEGARAKKQRKTTPYGVWEQIQEEEDPYDNVDLQLPQAEGFAAGGLDELPPEPKPKFKERTVTSLGEGGGPASFKKTRALNGKSRSLRQRGREDD